MRRWMELWIVKAVLLVFLIKKNLLGIGVKVTLISPWQDIWVYLVYALIFCGKLSLKAM